MNTVDSTINQDKIFQICLSKTVECTPWFLAIMPKLSPVWSPAGKVPHLYILMQTKIGLDEADERELEFLFVIQSSLLSPPAILGIQP